jgi:hypothetical protein
MTCFADLHLAAIRQRKSGRDRQLILWALLRDGDDGRGFVSTESISAARYFLDWTPRLLRGVIEQGQTKFWRAHHAGLYLTNPAHVALALGAESFRAMFRTKRTDLQRPLKDARAYLGVRAMAAVRGGYFCSIQDLAKALNVSEKTAQRWKRASKVRAIKNYALIEPVRAGVSLRRVRQYYDKNTHLQRYNDQPWYARRLPDSLDTTRVRGASGHLRRQNKRLNRLSRKQAPFANMGEGSASSRHRQRTLGPSTLRTYRSLPKGATPAGVRFFEGPRA